MATCSSDKTEQKSKLVFFIHSEEYVKLCDKLPKVQFRASLTHSLIRAYGLLNRVCIVAPKQASSRDLTAFHSQDYIEFLQKVEECYHNESFEEEELEEFGLGYDCPLFEEVFQCASMIAGGSLIASQKLVNGECSVAVNWQGGWHHGQRDSASGFCYINDVVLAILKLREKFDRVLYIDLDLHHGDGVEDAFIFTPKVMTVSFHKYCQGFFPGTGSCRDVGVGKGKYYTLNIPLKDGITDKSFCQVFQRIISKVRSQFRPDAIVCQCGADGLATDPMASFNITQYGLGSCLKYILSWKLPTLVLGGGGYNITDTARCWTFLTAVILNTSLPRDIPDHQHFLKYGPGYQLDINPGLRPDLNTKEDLENICQTVSGYLRYVN